MNGMVPTAGHESRRGQWANRAPDIVQATAERRLFSRSRPDDAVRKGVAMQHSV